MVNETWIKQRLAEIGRFSLAGLANTLLGFLLIAGLQFTTGRPFLANILGYVFGSLFAYLLHARYTFKSHIGMRSLGIYLAIAASGIALNLLVLGLSLRHIPTLTAQALAVSSYALYSYLLQSRFAFSQRH